MTISSGVVIKWPRALPSSTSPDLTSLRRRGLLADARFTQIPTSSPSFSELRGVPFVRSYW
jgi:hypothetical protein